MVHSSLQQDTFSQPVKLQMRQHVRSSRSVRARPTVIPTPEKPEPAKIGLGLYNVDLSGPGPFRSYVGYDRKAS